MSTNYRPWLKSLAGLSINISAAWFGLALITPNFINSGLGEFLIVLTRDVTFGIVFLLI